MEDILYKIIDRYYRSLENLLQAIRYSYRSYVFDNSNDLKLIAEKTPKTISLIEKDIPSWFYNYVVKKL
jgi:predicted ABC-type ATPase